MTSRKMKHRIFSEMRILIAFTFTIDIVTGVSDIMVRDMVNFIMSMSSFSDNFWQKGQYSQDMRNLYCQMEL